MIFATRSLQGSAIEMSSRCRPLTFTAEQTVAERQAIWLHAYEVGIIDPRTGKIKRRKRCDIARIWGVSIATVRNGLRAARERRELILAVASGH